MKVQNILSEMLAIRQVPMCILLSTTSTQEFIVKGVEKNRKELE